MTESRSRRISSAVERYGKRLLAFIRDRVPTREEAEDILQTVWYQLSDFGGLEEIEEIGAWLYAVARNRITDAYRVRRSSTPLPDEEENSDGRNLLPADAVTPEILYERAEFWEQVSRAMEELPPEQRQVFVMNEIEGRTFEEIARETGVNIKTLISRKRYALRHLRTRLNELYTDYFEE